jgi:hypothetical protein
MKNLVLAAFILATFVTALPVVSPASAMVCTRVGQTTICN